MKKIGFGLSVLLLLASCFTSYFWAVSFRRAVVFSDYPHNDPNPNRLLFKVEKGQVEYVRGYISLRWAKRAFTTRHIILSGFEWEDLHADGRRYPGDRVRPENKRTVQVSMWWSLLLLLPSLFCLAYVAQRRMAIKAGHCKKCGYDLTGNSSGICPECGLVVPVD
jgi:hypothetical protein